MLKRYSRLIFFGAGASYGSPGILPAPPPLGANLYDVLVCAFPDSWGRVSDTLRADFEAHFETGMAALLKIYPGAIQSLVPGAPSPHVLMQDMARLFLSYRLTPRRNDLYTSLILELIRAGKIDDACFATINYEHLIEQAMVRCGVEPRVLRPHGGCQLWIKRGGRLFGNVRAIGQGAHCVSARIKTLPPDGIERRLDIFQQSQYPCMAMYLEGKITQMGQRYLSRVQHRFAHRTQSASSLTLIGIRPWPADSHIWGPVSRTEATVLYVGGESGFADLLALRGTEHETVFVSDRFDKCIGDLVRRI